MADQHKHDVAIVVASCDKYSDLWPPLFDLFFKYWPDCPYLVYLVANEQRFDHERVTTLLAGEDKDWSSTIIAAVSDLPQSHLLFWIDDAFLSSRVDTAALERVLVEACDRNMACLRLRPDPTPAEWADRHFGELESSAAYRVSLFGSFWRKTALFQILKAGESAWEFEVNGTERSRSMDGFFCTRKNPFMYLHGVERGVWIRPTAMDLERRGYALDYRRRPVMSRKANVGLTYRILKTDFLHLMPSRHRSSILRAIQTFYRLVGLR
jgi:hypothetical protein